MGILRKNNLPGLLMVAFFLPYTPANRKPIKTLRSTHADSYGRRKSAEAHKRQGADLWHLSEDAGVAGEINAVKTGPMTGR